MRKFIAICLAMILCVSLLSVTALADAYANLSVSNATATRGEEVTLNVNLGNNPGIAGMELFISWDNTQLEKVAFTGSSAIGGTWTIDNDAVWDNGGDSTYNGQILTLKFKVKDTATCGSTTKVTVSGDAGNWLDDENIILNAGSGTVTIDHVYGAWTVVTPATCVAKGTEERVCSVCGEKQTRDIDMVAHTYGAWTVVTPATCTAKGSEERVCSVCGDKQTRDIDAAGHSWSKWKVVTAATCTTEGKEERKCSACGEVESKVIAAKGHDVKNTWYFNDDGHWHECDNNCGNQFDYEKHDVKEESNYLGQTRKYCSKCDWKTDYEGEIPDDVPPTGDITILYMGGALILLAIACTAVIIVKRKTV